MSTMNLSYDVRKQRATTEQLSPSERRAEKVLSRREPADLRERARSVMDPALTTDQARALGDWVAAKGPTVTDIFITHGHGNHWFAAGLLASCFGAGVAATTGTIAQMHANVAGRPFLWDKVFPGSRHRLSHR